MTLARRALSAMFAWVLGPPPARREATASPELIGERLRLRVLRASDAEAMWRIARDPTVTRFLPWEPMPSPGAILPFIEDQEARRRRGDALCFAVLDKTSGELIGSTDLVDIRRYLGTGAELGYLLSRDYWGKGIMSEAARLTADYAFGPMKLSRLTAFADIENRASRRVLEKLGMEQTDNEWRMVKNERRLYLRYEMTNRRSSDSKSGG